MDRPEKFKYIVSTPNKKEDRFKFHEDCGYNRAIDDYEAWLKEVIIEIRENHEEDGAENISDDSLKAFNQGQENGYLAALNDIENKS